MDGQPNIFAVYKPKGPTSHDLMYTLKRKYPGQKVGHAGTLDPLAHGVLVVGVGRSATKLLHTEEFSTKEYLATIKLGETSTTDDEEGQKRAIEVAKPPTEQEVDRVLQAFVGTIEQVPPQYSAVKLAGVPAYKKARRGQATELAARTVTVSQIALLSYQWPYLKILIETGPGVYVRSLARDLGEKLGTGGYIADLERTRVGRFGLEDTVPINGD